MNIKQILQRIPVFASKEDLEITELTGGITNKNYKITLDGESFVLRMGGNETKHLGIDRAVEYECSRLASQIGVAPDPVVFIAPEGFILRVSFLAKGCRRRRSARRKISNACSNP